MQTLLLVGFCLSLLLLLLLLRRRPSSKSPPPPPGPLCLPLIGLLPQLFVSAAVAGENFRFRNFLLKLAGRYGNLCSFRLGIQRFVLISEASTLSEAAHSRSFSFRLDKPFFRFLSGKMGIAMADGGLWRRQRRFVLNAFRMLGVTGERGQQLVTDEWNSALRHLTRLAGTGRVGEVAELDVADLLFKSTFNVISQILFSSRCPFSSTEFSEFRLHMDALTRGDFVTLLITCYPNLPLKPMLKASSGTRQLVVSNEWMEAEMLRRAEAAAADDDEEEEEEPKNFVQAFFAERRRLLSLDAAEAADFTDRQLSRCCYDICLGGTDSTANTLRWLLLLAAAHQKMQKKCRLEIQREIGDRQVESRDRSRLHWVRAFIDETLRLCAPLPLGVNTRVDADTQLRGHTVHKEDFVVLNLFACSRDSRQFPEPEKFNPDRFIDRDTGCHTRPPQFLAFGTGRRSCIGEDLARREIFVFFVGLLQNFHFHLPADADLASLLRGSDGVVNAPPAHKLRITQLKL